MKTPNKSIILIDGSNFYFKLKDLGLQNQLNFSFSGFCEFLTNSGQVYQSVYYIGRIKTDGSSKTKKLFDNQQRLLSHLKKHHIDYSFGYLLKSGGKYHEKGVDVNMAVDMLVAAYENRCQSLLLVSSDTDLLPAVRKAKEKGKQVEYIGFSHQPSVAMVANCSRSRLLTKEDLKPFIINKKSRK